MVNFTVERMQEVMRQRKNIRNMAVIAHVDHGKTTLTDSLLAKAGMIASNQAGDKRATDTRKDEQEKGITIKSTVVSMCFDMDKEVLPLIEDGEVKSSEFMVNLVDSPGHVDFSPEVTAALRVSDGAMVVVDAISGVCVQTETVLRQALSERIKPVLVINKVDRAVFEKQLGPEELYRSLRAVVDKVNAVVSIYAEEESPMGSLTLDPSLGNVVFASGLHGWAFSLRQFARMYATKLKVTEEKMMKRLWGDNFYDASTKKWTHTQTENSERGFNKFILEPLMKMLRASKDGDVETTIKLLVKLGLKLSAEEQEKAGKDLMRTAMKRWLPAADAMVEMIVTHLPSPVRAQAYRTACLYEGPLDDEAAMAMKNCDPEGPVMMYISKMVPAADKGRFYAVGRVFSGTVASGLPVRIMGPGYKPDAAKKKDIYFKKLSGVKLMMGGSVASLEEAPCGNIVGLVGLDKYLLKTGTISTFENAHNIKVLKFSVSPVVRVAVDVVKPSDLRQLIEGMKRLSKSDPMVQCTTDGGQYIVAGAGELHLEICLKDLETMHAGVPIKKSEPVVRYCETVTAVSEQVCLAKSGNKLNRLFMTAQPLPQGLPEAIDEGTISATQNVKERARNLSDTFGFDVNQAHKIWCFGPEGSGPNMLVDTSFAVQHLQDIRDTVVAGFQWASSEGVLCEETLRGVRFNVTDATIHSDPAHRGGGQIIPTTRRAMRAAMLTAQPRLLEPVFLVEVQCTDDVIGGVMGVLAKRRGNIVEEIHSPDSPLCVIRAHMPVNEGFGFTEELRGSTGGKAFPQCVFDHWQVLPGNPLDPASLSGAVVTQVRQRKGLPATVPGLENYLDKL
ncbi:elongation factor 2-like [Littorina saxatilis]|uniref:Tr-type G domain-containing protein n=1 Tax=Littorina saxatilis TaxID=31220 RepID=A0AAN9GGC7_9CAEN